MVKSGFEKMKIGDEIMASENALIDAVMRFTNSDIDEFRRQWNSQIDGVAETAEKQVAFDAARKNISQKNLLAGGISAKVRIKYISLSGESKERDVVIRRVFKKSSEVLIDALCLDINAPRLIKMKNILQLIDVQTKTLYTKPDLFFEEVFTSLLIHIFSASFSTKNLILRQQYLQYFYN